MVKIDRAFWAISFADRAIATGNTKTAARQLHEALLCNRSPRVLATVARLTLKSARKQPFETLRALLLSRSKEITT